MDFTTLTQNIEEKLDLSTYPEEVKSSIIIKLAENILERSNLAIAEALTENEAEEIASLIKHGKIEVAMNLLSEKHPELDEKIIVISNEIIAEFLEA
jgi:hypothetical protein